ncbi:MAG: transposase [Bacteroidales bacterium]|nr:transposase [Bacteroidales bacterium]
MVQYQVGILGGASMFVLNKTTDYQEYLFDPCRFIPEKTRKILDNSWAHYFAEDIFPMIDEEPYSKLYSDKFSRPNTPVNVQVGALILKAYLQRSDDQFLEDLNCDIRLQYALHLTNWDHIPFSDRTLSRFRKALVDYEKETGIDLLHNTITDIAAQMVEKMDIDPSRKRMDSMMVESYMEVLTRLELFYHCVANLVREMAGNGENLPEELRHYTEKGDRNEVIYRAKGGKVEDQISTLLNDAMTLIKLCGTVYSESENYANLKRALREQTYFDENDICRLKESGDKTMNGEMLQNPSDPDATFREKAGKQHRGYVANVVETADENGGGIITEFDYKPNTYSDSQFTRDVVDAMGYQESDVKLIADGAYYSEGNRAKAAENNIELIPTNLTGRTADEFLLKFEIGEDNRVLKCPAGNGPKSSNYNNKSGQICASFYKEQCEGCPYHDQCHPKECKTTCKKVFTANSVARAELQQNRNTEEFKENSAYRNGIESIPSVFRRRYGVDSLPVRGLLATKLLLCCIIAAFNLDRYTKRMNNERWRNGHFKNSDDPYGGEIPQETGTGEHCAGGRAFDVQSASGAYCAQKSEIA